MMSKRKRSFKEEFQLKKIRYNFDDFGESKLIFVQSKVSLTTDFFHLNKNNLNSVGQFLSVFVPESKVFFSFSFLAT